MKSNTVRLVILSLVILLNFLTVSPLEISHHEESKRLLNSHESYKNILKHVRRNEVYYTQGLFFDTDKTVIESGGLYGESCLVRMEYPSMKIINKVNLDGKYFGEGTAKCGKYVYQLTWQNRVILRYSYPELQLIETLPLDPQIKEGWGLTSDDQIMYATDGTNNIYYLDCESLQVTKKIEVSYQGEPLRYLNALVYVNGEFYVNKYYDNRIFKINASNGHISSVYDMSFLAHNEFKKGTLTQWRMSSGEVLNGIAYNKQRNVFLVTGKKWGFYYEIKFN